MGEHDQAGQAEDQGDAKRHQRDHGANRQAIDHLLQEDLHERLILPESA